MSGRDVGTVMWKEVRELGDMLSGGSRAQMVVQAFAALFFGVVSPIRDGPGWVSNPMANIFYPAVAMMLVLQPVADTFAGERERHTLETLLSTRLDDSSILLGKLLGVLAPVWVVTAGLYLIAIITTNLIYHTGSIIIPSVWAAGMTLGSILLVPGLMGTIGVFVSLNAPTVRKAAQTLGLIVMALLFVPVIAAEAAPAEWKVRVAAALDGTSPRQLFVYVAAALALVDTLLLAAAMKRFRRGRLTLD